MNCVFEKMKKDNKMYVNKVREIYRRMDLGHDENTLMKCIMKHAS